MHEATPSELEEFEKEGFFVRKRVFSEAELVDLRDAIECVHAQVLEAAECDDAGPVDRIDNQRYQLVCGSTVKWEWGEDLRAVRSMEPVHHLDPRLGTMIDDPRLWMPCCDIIRSRQLSLFSDKLNAKRPGGAPFPWHQEGPYWQYGAEKLESIVSTFTYLDDANQENGCLWVVPGSHTDGALPSLDGRGVLGALYTDIEKIDCEPHPIVLPAGSVVWFHYDIVHGSQTNRTDSDRRAFVAAYQPAGLQRWRVDGVRAIPGADVASAAE